MTESSGIRIHRTTTSAGLKSLRSKVAGYEKRYQRSSDEMLRDVKSGKVAETADVSKWLVSYHVLRKWEG